MQKLACIILAAGKGTRMKSDLPKPLHPVAGQAMVRHVMDAASALSPEKLVVVVGQDMDALDAAVAPHFVAVQEVPNGTGGAVKPARQYLDGFDGDVVILFGDSPLVTKESIEKLVNARRAHPDTGLVFSAMLPDDPGSYGRMIVEKDDILDRIVEYKDCTEEQRKITLCNGGIMCADGRHLFGWLDRLSNDNAQGEYYVTHLPEIARADNLATRFVELPEDDMAGINSREDLARVEKLFQNRLRKQAMENGVTLQDPDTVMLCFDTEIAHDVTIGAHVVFGRGVKIESGAEILPFCHLEDCVIRKGAKIGPFARIRPGSDIGENAKIGNFVETKKAKFGKGAKASHLSYLGDAEIGDGANIGAGTITCNYDGFLKYKTVIGKEAFIGSNSALIAPVTIGDGAYVGAGSAVSGTVPADGLAVTRAKTLIREEWAKKFRDKKRKEKEQGV